MVLFKCKACGGDVVPNEDGFTGKCEYCGSIQTLPKDKGESISQFLNRANDYRLNSEFDRAIFEYEKVLEINETEPEAHWGLFLSKYGVEYVKDPNTYVYKPTLHRISSVSVFDDVDYKATLKYSDMILSAQYKSDAEKIETVMKELLLISANQDAYDVFLSYKEADDITKQRTDDSYLAHDLYNELTAQGYKVFFAPKSLGVGLYEPKIYSAIISSKVMIVLGTKSKYFNAVWVKNEWSRFAELIENGEDKALIPVFKNMKAEELPNRLAQYQALNMSNISFLPTLFNMLSEVISKRKSNVKFNGDTTAEDAYLERGFLALEDRNFSQAEGFFENALNLNPHSSQAYFGKLMVEMHITKQSQILTSSKYLIEYSNFEKAVRFADQQLKTTLLQYEEKVKNALDEQKYNKAISLINQEKITESNYTEAAEIFKSINYFKEAKLKEEYCVNQAEILRKDKVLDMGINACGDFSNINQLKSAADYFKSIPGWKDADERLEKCEKKSEKILLKQKAEKTTQKLFKLFCVVLAICFVIVFILSIPKIKFNSQDKILLKSDGSVIATGEYDSSKSDLRVGNWYDIVDIAVGNEHVVGLKSDGTVVATEPHGYVYYGQCEVDDWKNVIAIDAGNQHTLGLKSDGTVVATNVRGAVFDYVWLVDDWKNIVAISAGYEHNVGLKSNGTVVAVSKENSYGECNVEDWKNIVAIAAGGSHTVGLKSDGTVVATGDNGYGQCDVGEWTDIIAIAAGRSHTVGLKSDGTVVAIGNHYEGQCDVGEWTDITTIFANEYDTVGLKSNGTIVYAGNDTNCEIVKYKDDGVVSVVVNDLS